MCRFNGSVATLEDVLFDFPFVDDASRADALAVLITPIVRPAIKGHVPIALLKVPTQGTGKGLLSEVISIISTGRPATMFSLPKTDDALRNQITYTLLGSPSLILIDNVEGMIDFPSLASVVTLHEWKDRLLVTNKIVSLPHRATWIINGNNIILGGGRVRIQRGTCAGMAGVVDSAVFQKTADYPDDYAAGYHVVLEDERVVTVRWDQGDSDIQSAGISYMPTSKLPSPTSRPRGRLPGRPCR